jgi:sorting nexin-29
VYQLFIDYKKAYDSVRREALLNILIEFSIHRKMVRLIKMCLNETYCGVWVGKHLSDMFSIKNIFKKGGASYPLFFIFALKYSIRRIQVKRRA